MSKFYSLVFAGVAIVGLMLSAPGGSRAQAAENNSPSATSEQPAVAPQALPAGAQPVYSYGYYYSSPCCSSVYYYPSSCCSSGVVWYQSGCCYGRHRRGW